VSEFAIAIFGYPPSFGHSAGPMMCLVRARVGEVLVDRERNRCRIDSTPAVRDLDKWSSPVGLILAARRGECGLSIVEDHYRGSPPPPFRRDLGSTRARCRAPREPSPVRGRFARASIPGDLCSCLRCRDLVIARRDEATGRPAGYTAPGRLWPGAIRCLDWLSGCQGPGAAAVRHGIDCASFDLARASPIVPHRRRRSGLLGQLLRRLAGDPIFERLRAARGA
jgi:hypothetical protein